MRSRPGFFSMADKKILSRYSFKETYLGIQFYSLPMYSFLVILSLIIGNKK